MAGRGPALKRGPRAVVGQFDGRGDLTGRALAPTMDPCQTLPLAPEGCEPTRGALSRRVYGRGRRRHPSAKVRRAPARRPRGG